MNRLPESGTVVLMSESPDHRHWTRHRYVGTQRCVVEDQDGVKGDAWEHLYRCDVTGVVRRYGCEDLLVATDGD